MKQKTTEHNRCPKHIENETKTKRMAIWNKQKHMAQETNRHKMGRTDIGKTQVEVLILMYGYSLNMQVTYCYMNWSNASVLGWANDNIPLTFRSSTGSAMRWLWRALMLSENPGESLMSITYTSDTQSCTEKHTEEASALSKCTKKRDHAPVWGVMALDFMLQDKESTSAKKKRKKRKKTFKKKMDTALLFSSLLSMSRIHTCILDCDVLLYSTF